MEQQFCIRISIHQCHVQCVEILPNSNADVDTSTPLLWATYHGDEALVDKPSDSGADPNSPSDDGYPITSYGLALHVAAENGFEKIVGRLIRASAIDDARGGSDSE